MLNSPLVAHHPGNLYSKYRYGMTPSSRSSLNDWSLGYGFPEPPSPPAAVGPPLLDEQQQMFFTQLFDDMPSNMVPLVDAHVFDPELPKEHTLWPGESVPRDFHTDNAPESLSSAERSYYGHPAVSAPPMPEHHVEVNPFGTSHGLHAHATPQHQHQLQQPHASLAPPPILAFGTDTNFAANGYQAPILPDRELHIRDRVLSALTKNDSRVTTAANSPSEVKYEHCDDQDTDSQSREDNSMSPQAGMKRRADDGDDYPPNKSARRSRPRSSEPGSGTKPKKKSSGQKRDNLTEAQKRENHIHSEQKRRNLIRQGFEELCALVPELKAGGYSKSAVLIHAANYLDDLKKGNARLRIYLQQLESARDGGY